MKKILLCVLLISAGTCAAIAADRPWSVANISKDLLKGANAVLRLEEVRFEIRSTNETKMRQRYVITILNEQGAKWAEFSEHYDRYRQVESVEGYLYDAAGNDIKKVKKKDLQDLSAVSDMSLMEDNRVKAHNFYYKAYPYTIEYIVDIENKATLFFPSWTPQAGEGLAVEKSTMTVVCLNDYKFRYKAFNYKKEPEIAKDKNTTTYTWATRDLKALWRESYSPLWHEMATMVIFGPTEFQMDDYKGVMSDWKEFGKFINALKTGRDQLPENIRQEVHRLTDGLKDPAEKVRVLYEYMQKNTRYISIQLGIGGWQPFDAKYVASKGYGDCKALTNYMYSLLKEAGIPSRYSVIRAGNYANYITADFPSQQFNHVILCVPLPRDSIWLECTSQTLPAGYLSGSTSDRFALMIDDAGGQLVRTPVYGIEQNVQQRVIKSVVKDDGTLEAKVSTRYTGMQQDELHGLINHFSREKVKEYLHEELDFATYEVADFRYDEQKSNKPSINESLDLVVSNYANITGKRLFIVPNIMNRSSRKVKTDSTRRYDVQLNYPYRDVDSIEIEIPKGFSTEAMPQDVSIKSIFGTYASSVKFKDNKIFYVRKIEHFGGRFPASEYNNLAKFYETIYKADRNRVVLVRQEEPLKAF